MSSTKNFYKKHQYLLFMLPILITARTVAAFYVDHCFSVNILDPKAVQSRWYNPDFKTFTIEDCKKYDSRISVKGAYFTIEPKENAPSVVAELEQYFPKIDPKQFKNYLSKNGMAFTVPIFDINIDAKTYKNYKKLKDPTWPNCRKHVLYTEPKVTKSKLYLPNPQGEFPGKDEESPTNTIFFNEIILKGLTIPAKNLAFVELIDDRLFFNSYGLYAHFVGEPNPSHHWIALLNLDTMEQIGAIFLPMPTQYQYGRYRYRLFKVDENNIYLKDCRNGNFVQFCWHNFEKNNPLLLEDQEYLSKKLQISANETVPLSSQ